MSGALVHERSPCVALPIRIEMRLTWRATNISPRIVESQWYRIEADHRQCLVVNALL